MVHEDNRVQAMQGESDLWCGWGASPRGCCAPAGTDPALKRRRAAHAWVPSMALQASAVGSQQDWVAEQAILRRLIPNQDVPCPVQPNRPPRTGTAAQQPNPSASCHCRRQALDPPDIGPPQGAILTQLHARDWSLQPQG